MKQIVSSKNYTKLPIRVRKPLAWISAVSPSRTIGNVRSKFRLHKPYPMSRSIPYFRPKRIESHTLCRRTYLYNLCKGEPSGVPGNGTRQPNTVVRKGLLIWSDYHLRKLTRLVIFVQEANCHELAERSLSLWVFQQGATAVIIDVANKF